MLSALSIRDIVLIRELDIDFDDGLAVLSGETGAGKSILLDSLSLALGARGDGDLVRIGQKQGQVSAIFDVPVGHAVFEILRQNDLDGGNADGEEPVILRRIQSADGRTRAYINDQPVSVALLRSVGQLLVEIHGQHEERAMIDPTAHRNLVDAFGGLTKERNSVAEAHRDWKDAAKALKQLRDGIEQAARDADYLRSSVEELTVLSPQEGGRRRTGRSAPDDDGG